MKQKKIDNDSNNNIHQYVYTTLDVDSSNRFTQRQLNHSHRNLKRRLPKTYKNEFQSSSSSSPAMKFTIPVIGVTSSIVYTTSVIFILIFIFVPGRTTTTTNAFVSILTTRSGSFRSNTLESYDVKYTKCCHPFPRQFWLHDSSNAFLDITKTASRESQKATSATPSTPVTTKGRVDRKKRNVQSDSTSTTDVKRKGLLERVQNLSGEKNSMKKSVPFSTIQSNNNNNNTSLTAVKSMGRTTNGKQNTPSLQKNEIPLLQNDDGKEVDPSDTRIVSQSPGLSSQQIQVPINRSTTDNSNVKPISNQLHYDLEYIKKQIDLVSIMESFHLKSFRRTSPGRAVAVCPFHDDHNPSLQIDGSNLRMYKCFSCGAGGDVFKFLHEYSNLPNNNNPSGAAPMNARFLLPPMTYGQSIQYVLRNYIQDTTTVPTKPVVAYNTTKSQTNLVTSSKIQTIHSSSITSIATPVSPEELIRIQYHKNRILLANTAATKFYFDQISQIRFGHVRHYLRSRGLTIPTIASYFIGYAPDCYFQNVEDVRSSSSADIGDYYDTTTAASSWGKGSLVWHLRDLGFTPNEIYDSGLAVRTKRYKETQTDTIDANLDVNEMNDNNKPKLDDTDYESLMDRFRDRIVVPIFDTDGKFVVGFGGRILPEYTDPNVSDDTNDTVVGDSNNQRGTSKKFKPPKYLNSPESVVFEKRKILFGYHQASVALKESTKDSVKKKTESPSPADESIVLVEGYLDAVTLHSTGIQNVVATMGTAVSAEQLSLAATMATISHTSAGRIIIALDNDNAGISATERICSNGMLLDIVRDYPGVEIKIARLPHGIKDPAEFIESIARNSTKATSRTKAADMFKNEILNQSVNWIDWYAKRIISRYNATVQSGEVGCFGEIFEKVALFLATSCGNSPDRTTRISAGALELLETMKAKSTLDSKDSSHLSEAVLIQLEADLLDQTTRIVRMNEAVQKRTESVYGDTFGSKNIMSVLLNGKGPDTLDTEDEAKLSARASGRVPGLIDEDSSFNSDNVVGKKKNAEAKVKTFPQKKRPRVKLQRLNDSSESITPHFSGLRFEHKTDMQWLGIDNVDTKAGKKADTKLALGYTPMSAVARENAKAKGLEYKSTEAAGLTEGLVYFNSVDYHGSQFLTEDAAIAGYGRGSLPVTPDSSIFETGIAGLLVQDVTNIALEAENALLRELVRNKPARLKLGNVKEVSNFLNSVDAKEKEIEWTHPAKEWLFDSLLGFNDDTVNVELPSDIQELRLFLANRVNSPPGSFALTEAREIDPAEEFSKTELPFQSNNHKMPTSIALSPERNETGIDKGHFLVPSSENGALDIFFTDLDTLESEPTNSIVTRDDYRGELQVQELFGILMWTSACAKAKEIRSQLTLFPSPLSKSRDQSNSSTNRVKLTDKEDPEAKNGSSLVSDRNEDLDDLQMVLLGKLQKASVQVQVTADALKKLMNRLVDHSTSVGHPEGRVSHKVQFDLRADMDKFLAEHDFEMSNELAPELAHLFKEGVGEPYEDALRRMEAEWGEWYDDDYMWSSEDSKNVKPPSGAQVDILGDETESESIEAALNRIEREWGE